MEEKVRDLELKTAKHGEQIGFLKSFYKEQSECIKEIKDAIVLVREDMSNIEKALITERANRPTWAVSIALMLLSSLVVGLSVYAVGVA